MNKAVFIATTEAKSGKSLISIGLMQMLLGKTAKVGYFRPIIADYVDGKIDNHINTLISYFNLDIDYKEAYAFTRSEVIHKKNEDKDDEIISRIIDKYKAIEDRFDFILVEGTDFSGEGSIIEWDINALIAKKYAIPNNFYSEHGIQVYGFHGTSHKYVSEKAIQYLGLKNSKIISIHLGNGCSITAIKDGKSIDHSLGFGPSNGLIMGSRSGDIDQSVIFYLVNNLGYCVTEINNILNKKSGMLGLTGYSDLRNIEVEAEKGNKDCQLALEMNAYRIKKYIGAYVSVMNGLDAIIFTAGIGENSSTLRQLICNEMDYLGIQIDNTKNEIRSNALREIQHSSARVKIIIIPTNEELEIAKQSYQLLS